MDGSRHRRRFQKDGLTWKSDGLSIFFVPAVPELTESEWRRKGRPQRGINREYLRRQIKDKFPVWRDRGSFISPFTIRIQLKGNRSIFDVFMSNYFSE